MAVFYINSPTEGIIELTSTTDIKINETSTVSKHPLETGDSIVDNVVVDNITVAFNGVISDIRSIFRSNTFDDGVPAQAFENPVEGVINSLRNIKNTKQLFTVHYDRRFASFRNCVLTSLSLDKNAQTGLGYNINLSFEQVRITGRADISVSRELQQKPDDTQGKTNSGPNNQKKTDIVGTTSLLNVRLEATGQENTQVIYTEGNNITGVQREAQ